MSAAALALPLRERNKQEKRAALLSAARALFARRGFAATTTAEIASRAGVGAGTLFLYFASKDDLLVAIFRADMDAVVERAFATLPPRGSLLAEVLHVYGAMVALHERDPQLARAFVKEMLFVGAANRASVFEFIDRLDERIAARVALRQARGELDSKAPPVGVAENLFALYIARLQKWLGFGERLASDELLARLGESFALQLSPLAVKPPRAKRRTLASTRRA